MVGSDIPRLFLGVQKSQQTAFGLSDRMEPSGPIEAPDGERHDPHAEKYSQNNYDEMKEEIMALGRICNAMNSFARVAGLEVQRWAANLNKLSERHRHLVESEENTMYSFENPLLVEAIHHNDMLLRSILDWLSEQEGPFPLHKGLDAMKMWNDERGDAVSPADFEKVLYVLKNIARDWSSEYKDERERSFGRICQELELSFPDRSVPPRVLIPGCGLARLCVDLASHSFDVSGNEHSFFMLLTTAYILNGTVTKDQWTIYPWVLQSSNFWSLENQLQPISFPDVVPSEAMNDSSQESNGCLSMLAGDFVEVFSSGEMKEAYDAVVTCFFLDTAHNVIEYLEIIWDILESGGVWIHLGPLQWHWADAHTYLAEEELSIELPLDKIIEIAKNIGFVFEGNVERISCPYMSNINSMRPQVYECAFWKARKPVYGSSETSEE